jgi:hypothetical protein
MPNTLKFGISHACKNPGTIVGKFLHICEMPNTLKFGTAHACKNPGTIVGKFLHICEMPNTLKFGTAHACKNHGTIVGKFLHTCANSTTTGGATLRLGFDLPTREKPTHHLRARPLGRDYTPSP